MHIICLNLLIISPFWMIGSPLEGSQHPGWQPDIRLIYGTFSICMSYGDSGPKTWILTGVQKVTWCLACVNVYWQFFCTQSLTQSVNADTNVAQCRAENRALFVYLKDHISCCHGNQLIFPGSTTWRVMCETLIALIYRKWQLKASQHWTNI